MAKAAQRGGAPQAARVRRVLPDIEQPGAAPDDEGNVVGPVEDRGQRDTIRGKPRIGKARQGRGTLRVDPAYRGRIVDLLEPAIRVVVGGVEVGIDVVDNPLVVVKGRVLALRAVVSCDPDTGACDGEESVQAVASTMPATGSPPKKPSQLQWNGLWCA